jgi:diaminopimelate epimerase
MKLHFTKMHGLGNDFIVINAIDTAIHLSQTQLQFIADRHLGIGCDQILFVENYAGDEADFRYRIFNADGGEVEQCGNGARCFARFVVDQGLTTKTEIPVMTTSGKITLIVQDNGEVTVNMGVAITQPKNIPFLAEQERTEYTLSLKTSDSSQLPASVNFGAVSMGNPHAVLIVDNIETAPVSTLGAYLEQHSIFPNRVNVGFMQVLNPQHIRLRVFERGVGETQACGTGACAAVIVGILQNKLTNEVKVDLPGGQLTVQWASKDAPVIMTGAAKSVFTGCIEL